MPCKSINELRCYTDPIFLSANAAFQDVLYPHLSSHLLHIHSLAFVGEGGVPRDHEELRELGQSIDNLLCEPITEVFLALVFADVVKGQVSRKTV